MKRRYLCLFLCLYLGYICILNSCGTAGTVPQLFEKSGIIEAAGEEMADPPTIQIGGRVIRREVRENGIRLLLTDLSFPEGSTSGITTDTISGTTSETTSGTTSETTSGTTSETTSDNTTGTISGTASDTVSSTISNSVSHCTRDTAALTGAFFGMLSKRQRRSAAVLCSVTDDHVKPEDICRGDQVIVTGRFAMPEYASAPGEFDYRKYARARNIVFLLKDCRVDYLKRNISAGRLADRLADRFSRAFHRVLPPEDAAMLEVILLGRKEAMPDRLKQLYRDGGILHICTVSGLHISLLGMAVWDVMRKRRHSFAVSGFCSGALVLFYSFLTGNGTGAVRAAVMFIFWIGSQITGRTNDVPTALFAAAVLILRGRPYMLTDAGFALSFGCLLSLYLLEPLLRKAFRGLGKPWRRVFDRENPSPVTAGLAIWTGTVPLVCMYYYQITPWSLLVNLFLIPCMSVFMTAGLAAALAGMIFLPAGIFAAGTCSLILKVIRSACLLEQMLPGSVIITGSPRKTGMILYYAALFVWGFLMHRGSIHRRRRRRTGTFLRSCALLSVFALVLILPRSRNRGMRMIAADVGQGQCAIAWGRDGCFVFDCGSTSRSDIWKYRIEPLLKYYGISRISCVFLSHGDQDHTNGIEELLDGYKVGAAGMNTGGITVDSIAVSLTESARDAHLREVCKTAEEKGIRVWEMSLLSRLRFGSTVLTCLFPGDRLTDEANANSMVIRMESDGFCAVFPGDLEKEGETEFCRLLSEEKDKDKQKCDVLLAGHHGSKNANSDAFLELLKPGICVISCGRNNMYGHPAPETLSRLEKAGCEVFRTDLQRSILLWPAGDDKTEVFVYDPERGYKNVDTGTQ